jgi:1-acyl-sn-glycerol-3-phosphate acyltransferase
MVQFGRALLSIYVWSVVVIATIITFFITAILHPFDPDQKMSHQVACLWGKTIFAANPFWRLKVMGKKNLRGTEGSVLVANHMSLADIVTVFCIGNEFKWIAKSSLFKIPFFGWTILLLKYIPLERGTAKSIRDTMKRAEYYLSKKISVLFFPEGTRVKSGGMAPFKNGAFKLAVQTGRPIVPIVISGTEKALQKGKIIVTGKVDGFIKVLPKIKSTDYTPQQFGELKLKVWNTMNKAL